MRIIGSKKVNTKYAVRQGNAEERPDAGCKIYGKWQ